MNNSPNGANEIFSGEKLFLFTGAGHEKRRVKK